MSIVVYSDVRVPDCTFLASASGRSTRQNDRTTNQGGYATANVVRDVTLRQYTFGVKPMSTSEWAEIMALYEITEAGAYGFLIEDPVDATVTQEQGVIDDPDGGYQLFKRYMVQSSSRYVDRKITRPMPTIVVYRNGVVMSSGYSVNYDTGAVSISAPGSDEFTWSGRFFVPVQFSSDDIDWDLVRPSEDVDDRVVMGPSVTLVEIRE